MRLIECCSIFVAACGLMGAQAHAAGMCQTPFMHDGGVVQLSGTGGVQLGANLAFSDVQKDGSDHCSARVRGKATYGLAGLPPGQSAVDYWMSVNNGKINFERSENGRRVPVNGKFDLRMLGLFTYGEPITHQGQTFPALKFQINLDKKAVATEPIVIHTGTRTVGAKQTLQTAAGEQSCWPVEYSRISEATQASFSGIVLPIPEMKSKVTDWFCPDVNMVMKQESAQGGVASVVEVTRLQ
ncbi:hypothetical protein [Pusillimonas sp. ANT_WB101]|uniref:hypothetical protein n=1 Tax=Pusillimonas sp. ANT_WB101 TaxID=2597356 RepID=UPI0021026544|nr:hypothetical protein [Pusillimonas sp. ANT_WB101]